jgi:hypothetical protein
MVFKNERRQIMKKITNYKLQVTRIAFCLLLSAFCIITNAQTDGNFISDSIDIQKNELKMPLELEEMVITKIKNGSIEKFYRYGIKNKEQLENLQLGKHLREYVIDIDNDTLMPRGWRVPTRWELTSLLHSSVVKRERTTKNGVNGMLFTDKNTGNSLFLPAVGIRQSNSRIFSKNIWGFYWSSIGSVVSYRADILFFNHYGFCLITFQERNDALPIRPVAK